MKKSYFRFPQIGRLRQLERVDADSDLVANVLALQDGEYLSFSRGVLPGDYGARRDEKALPVRWVPAFESEEHAWEVAKAYGVNVHGTRNVNLGLMGVGESLAFGWVPMRGTMKVVPFAELLEGARIVAYGYSDRNFVSPVDVERIYGEPTLRRGADVMVAVPSRTQGRGRYKFKMEHLPYDTQWRSPLVSEAFKTDHRCDRKSNYINHKAGVKGVEIICAHEVAALFQAAVHFRETRNIHLMRNLPIPIPTLDLLKEYAKLASRVIFENEDQKARSFGLIERSYIIGGGLIPRMGVESCFPSSRRGLERALKDMKAFHGWDARNVA